MSLDFCTPLAYLTQIGGCPGIKLVSLSPMSAVAMEELTGKMKSYKNTNPKHRFLLFLLFWDGICQCFQPLGGKNKTESNQQDSIRLISLWGELKQPNYLSSHTVLDWI